MFFFCSHWSLVDVPLIFFCPADHVPDWQPRILLGMVEARSVNAKKTTTTTTSTLSALNIQWHTNRQQSVVGKQIDQPKSECCRDHKKTRGRTPHRGVMEGAASGARTAAAGLSVSATLPIGKGQLFPTRGAARISAETELAAAGRAIKNGSSSRRVTFHVVCKTCGVACMCSMRRVSSENGGGRGQCQWGCCVCFYCLFCTPKTRRKTCDTVVLE